MEFALTAEQKLLQETLRDFARRELLPNYASRDADLDLPPQLARKLGELGVLAPMVDTNLGGSKLDYVALGIAHEEIARGDFNAAYLLLLAALAGAIISRSGDASQQAAFLPPICRGEIVAALAVTEPGGGSDAAHISLQARRDGDNYILSGEKTSISFSSSASTCCRPCANRHRRTSRSRRQCILRRSQFTGRLAHPLSRPGLTRNRTRPAFFRRRTRVCRRSPRRRRCRLRRGDARVRFQPFVDRADVHWRGRAKRRGNLRVRRRAPGLWRAASAIRRRVISARRGRRSAARRAACSVTKRYG